MGYYRIIKKLFRFIFKRIDIIIGIVLITIIVLSLYNNVFAATVYHASNGLSYYVPSYTPNTNTYPYYCLWFMCPNTNDTSVNPTLYYYQSTLPMWFVQDSSTHKINFIINNNGQSSSGFHYMVKRADSIRNSSTSWANVSGLNTDISATGSYSSSTGIGSTNYQTRHIEVVKANHNIIQYTNSYGNNPTTLYQNDINPYIENTITDIENWDFDNLIVNFGTLAFNENDVLVFTYNNIEYSIFLKDYVQTIGNGNVINPISIPINVLNNYIVFTENADITFEYGQIVGAGNILKYDMGTYSITLSTAQVNELNDNADRNIQNAILNTTEMTNEQLKSLNDNIMSTEFDDSDITFPTINVQDGGVIVAINNFFDQIYNAFTAGTLYDIVIPIPFTRKKYNYSL